MWENAKTGIDVPWVLIWCTIAIVGLAGIFFAHYYIKDALRRKPRKVEKIEE
ncbi:MAG: hypothetical protein J6R34_02520 [Clostridia bacterium]|nr:hypothetical protein [Clostridia bacterium]